MAKKIRAYQAKLDIKQVMDSNTLSPKVVISNITTEDGKSFPRDHVWIAKCKRVDKFIAKLNDPCSLVRVSFTAKEDKYRGSDGIVKKRLVQIGNLKEL